MTNLDPLIKAIGEASNGKEFYTHSFDAEGDQIVIVLKAVKVEPPEEKLLTE